MIAQSSLFSMTIKSRTISTLKLYAEKKAFNFTRHTCALSANFYILCASAKFAILFSSVD